MIKKAAVQSAHNPYYYLL